MVKIVNIIHCQLAWKKAVLGYSSAEFILLINKLHVYLRSVPSISGYHVSTNPNLNFIVYIPTSDQSPLMILDQSGNY